MASASFSRAIFPSAAMVTECKSAFIAAALGGSDDREPRTAAMSFMALWPERGWSEGDLSEAGKWEGRTSACGTLVRLCPAAFQQVGPCARGQEGGSRRALA